MPYTQKTLSDLKQSLADRHDSGTVPTDSSILAFYVRWLNKGQAYCADKLRITKLTSLTTSSGTIALPDDFLMIDSVITGDDVSLCQVGQRDVEKQDGLAYWITGNHADGFALNTPEDKTYTVIYRFKPTEMSSDSDVCVIPDPEAVVAYAYSFIRKSETDPVGDAGSALQECDARLTEMIDTQNINNSAIGFGIMDGVTQGATDGYSNIW
jgi:hypothetical protein